MVAAELWNSESPALVILGRAALDILQYSMALLTLPLVINSMVRLTNVSLSIRLLNRIKMIRSTMITTPSKRANRITYIMGPPKVKNLMTSNFSLLRLWCYIFEIHNGNNATSLCINIRNQGVGANNLPGNVILAILCRLGFFFFFHGSSFFLHRPKNIIEKRALNPNVVDFRIFPGNDENSLWLFQTTDNFDFIQEQFYRLIIDLRHL